MAADDTWDNIDRKLLKAAAQIKDARSIILTARIQNTCTVPAESAKARTTFREAATQILAGTEAASEIGHMLNRIVDALESDAKQEDAHA